MGTDAPSAGHRRVPHTADTRIEAWGPTREACLEQAVAAMVAGFAAGAEAEADFEFAVAPGGTDADLLAAVLEEVIFRLDTAGQVPVRTRVARRPDGGVAVSCAVVEVDRVDVIGAVPKAVSLHGLALGADQRGWRCQVTLDV